MHLWPMIVPHAAVGVVELAGKTFDHGGEVRIVRAGLGNVDPVGEVGHQRHGGEAGQKVPGQPGGVEKTFSVGLVTHSVYRTRLCNNEGAQAVSWKRFGETVVVVLLWWRCGGRSQ